MKLKLYGSKIIEMLIVWKWGNKMAWTAHVKKMKSKWISEIDGWKMMLEDDVRNKGKQIKQVYIVKAV